MAAEWCPWSYIHTYRKGSVVNINFASDSQKGLSITIDTRRWQLRSVTPKELELYEALYENRPGNWDPITREGMEAKLSSRVLALHQDDPFVPFSVFENATGSFLGEMGLSHSRTPGEAEFSFVFHQRFCEPTYIVDVAQTVCHDFAAAAVQEQYTLNHKPFNKITASVQSDDVNGKAILTYLGMVPFAQSGQWNLQRDCFSLRVKAISKPLGKDPKVISQVDSIFSGQTERVVCDLMADEATFSKDVFDERPRDPCPYDSSSFDGDSDECE